MEQNQALDKNISFKMLIKFSLPTIISMIFMSIYSSVDGVFVSRLVGTNALSSVNIVMPIVLMIMAIGTMFGSGGNALIAKKLGEGKNREAKRKFLIVDSCSVYNKFIDCGDMLYIFESFASFSRRR